MPRSPVLLPFARLSRRRFAKTSLTVATTTAMLPKLLAAQGREVNVYNWDTYIDEDTVPEFERASGISVRYDLFASSSEVFAKLRQGNPGYDVIYPSNDYASRMMAAEMLEPLDKSRIPNAANIADDFANPDYDPGRGYTLPYFWGSIGVGYRSSVAEVKRWADLFEGDAFDGRISFLDNRDTLQCTLKYLGYSGNTKNPQQIAEAADALIAIKGKIKTFTPDTGQDLLISGEVDACGEYNGDIAQVMLEDPDLSFVIPEEGSMVWEDVMCIPKDAPNLEAAHEWMNFIYQAETHASIAEYVQYALPNAAAKESIPEADLNNPALYPPDEVLARCEFGRYQGEELASLHEQAMTRVLAA